MTPVAVPIPRQVAVSAGAYEFRWMKVREELGVDISESVVTTCFAELGTVPAPGDFVIPDSVSAGSDMVDDVELFWRKVGHKVTAVRCPAGKRYVQWVLVADISEHVAIASPEAFPVP
jgi:hypothetical protein